MGARLRGLAAMVVAVALLAMGAAVPALSQDDDDERETLRLRSYFRKERTEQVNANEDGERNGVGDYEVGSGPLFRAGERAGNQRHVCHNLPGGNKGFTSHCVGTFVVTGRGTIEVEGTLKFARQGLAESNLAIVGGTGQFREADGTVKLNEHESSLVFEFHIIT